MSEKKGEQQNMPVKVKRKDRRGYFAQRTSIFFMLWAVFTALSLFIVIIFGVSQNRTMEREFRNENGKQFRTECLQIEADLLYDINENNTLTPNGTVQRLATVYEAKIFVLSSEGEVLLPFSWATDYEEETDKVEEENPDTDDKETEYQEKWKILIKRLSGANTGLVYVEDGDFVYGSKIILTGEECFLYISKAYDLTETITEQFTGRTLLMSIFMCILTFALSGMVSGWFTRPIIEMKEKAASLAHGNFEVDFHSEEYGQEMVELAEALNYARDELSKADAMQKELIANVSHDFKTPLTMMKAYASMIIEISGDIPEKRNKHAQVIIDETDRLTSLVSDMLELSKMRSGLEHLDVKVFDMSAYLHDVLSRFGYLTETKGYSFRADIDERLFTRGDETKLGQVLYNLIGNAVNYTGDNKQVFVSLKRKSENVFRFAVTDTGKGIKEEDLATIWDRYYRSSEAHKRPVRGTGLGLSIVKTVLEKHRFVFGVNSTPGVGSTFYVDFPLVQQTQEKTKDLPVTNA